MVTRKAMKKQDVSHSIMLISPDDFALKDYALYIAKMLMCEGDEPCNQCIQCKKIEHKNHADVLTFPREKESITVDEMLQIVNDVPLAPYESDKKIYILNNAGGINIQAQNKLLKTLEEPPKNVYFILNVTNEAKVLPTIKSRCRKIYLSPYSEQELLDSLKEFDLSEEQKLNIVAYCEGSKAKALDFARKENFSGLLDFVFDMWEKMRHSSQMINYAGKLYLLKTDFRNFLNLYNEVLQDILYVKLRREDLAKNKRKLDWYKKVGKDFSEQALTNIVKYCVRMSEKIERNCNLSIMVDNFLMTVLEERVKCL